MKELQEIVAANSSCFISHFLLAKIMWHSDLQSKAFPLFLKVTY